MKKETNSPLGRSLREELLKNDDFSKLEGPALFSYYLRAYCGRNDLSNLVTSDGPQHTLSKDYQKKTAQTLEFVRTELKNGNAKQVKQHLKSVQPSMLSPQIKAELFLERSRLQLMEAQPQEALKSIESGLALKASSISRLTLYQLKGHALLLLGQREEAIQSLKLAVSLSQEFPHAASGYAARGFLVQAYSEMGAFEKAKEELGSMSAMLRRFEQTELRLARLLCFLRSEIHYLRAQGLEKKEFIRLEECMRIARWLAYGSVENRTERELDKLLEKLSQNNSCPSGHLYCYEGWTFFRRLNIILIHSSNKEIHFLEKYRSAQKILSTIAQNGNEMEKDEFFEIVWKIKFRTERHASHLKAMLAKTRHFLPKGALSLQNALVKLS